MTYLRVIPAEFLSRQNRFSALVRLDGEVRTVHVKNTGRLRELLLPGVEVFLAPAENPGRKTAFDLVSLRRPDGRFVNIDSQAPNRVVREWLEGRGWDRLLPEYRYGASRLDFCLERGGQTLLLEVKGCTLERDGVGFFPDAPTDRGARHLRELTEARRAGLRAAAAFVIQMEGVEKVLPNRDTDPAFALALEEAVRAGVELWYLPCRVTPSVLGITDRIMGP